MTISYTPVDQVGFFALLFKWDGSIWKSIWRKLLLFCLSYGILSLIYRLALTDPQKRQFEKVALYFDRAVSRIPITFLLGFYVSQMVTRWWDQFKQLTFPDEFMVYVGAYIKSPNEAKALKIRRTLARYVNLATALTYRKVSIKVMKRFPTVWHFVNAKLLTEKEKIAFESIDASYGNFFVPICWAANLISRCQHEKMLTEKAVDRLLKELNVIRSQLSSIMRYDWVPVPLIYTQVATLATYGYFFFCIVSRQYLDPKYVPSQAIDLYIPVFTLLEMMFYMGWLQVAEDLFNPYGEDDEDFEMNWILDRNVHISYLMSDQLHKQIGANSDEDLDDIAGKLPHTKASNKVRDHNFTGHLANFKLKDKEIELALEDDIGDEPDASTRMFQNLVRSVLRKDKAQDRIEGDDSGITESSPLKEERTDEKVL